jgi:hypothetical protein
MDLLILLIADASVEFIFLVLDEGGKRPRISGTWRVRENIAKPRDFR